MWGRVWRCTQGHECVISEEEMLRAIVEPRCARRVGDKVCGERLTRPLRALS